MAASRAGSSRGSVWATTSKGHNATGLKTPNLVSRSQGFLALGRPSSSSEVDGVRSWACGHGRCHLLCPPGDEVAGLVVGELPAALTQALSHEADFHGLSDRGCGHFAAGD